MPFFLDSSPTNYEVSDAVNYLLSNFGGGGLSANPATGQITSNNQIIGYLYQYMAVKYADSSDGTLNFSNTPLNRLYYGLRNSNDASESSNPADYIWYQATGGFGVTKSLWYTSTGGRQIQFAVSASAPDTGWLVDPGTSIDLDIVTSSTVPVVIESFVPYFTPSILQVPRSGSPLTPSFTGITPVMYATNKGAVVPFTDAQTDSNVAFVNNSWRIGNSSTTGYGDISLTNITVGNPTDAGDYAQWPNPTAMSNSPAYITVPVRYKNSLGVVAQAGVATIQLVFVDPGSAGKDASNVDITGYTAFVQNAGGAFTPTSATLSAVLQNITSPTYAWTITGATPTSSIASSVVVTPTSSSTGVGVTLTVNGSNLSSPLTKTINMPVVYDGATGQAGSNGVMSAFPTIYIWTGSSAAPTRPSTTSTYTWATGAYTAPAGWSTTAPSNTTAGNYLWSITVPLNVTATTTTSTLDWTNTTYAIRSIAYNGTNGANGADGQIGSGTYVIIRSANDSSAPTNAEVNALIGRNPVAGDIATVNYNAGNNSTVYRYAAGWSLFTTYITGSLIVQNTITADKMVTNLMKTDNVLTRGLTVRDDLGNIILASGTPLNYSNIVPSNSWLNANITINADGTLSGAGAGQITPAGINAVNTNLTNAPLSILNSQISINSNGTLSNAGSGQVSLGGLGAGAFATLNQITSGNVSTYIAGAAIGTAQVGVLTANNIGAQTIDASKIAANTITADKIYSNTFSSDNVLTRGLTVRDSNGNIILAAGTPLTSFYITPSSTWLNSNITINADGTLNGAGSGQVTPAGINAINTNLTNAPSGILNSNISIGSNGALSGGGGGQVSLGGLGAGAFATLNQITSANVTTYIAGASIGTAQVGVLTAGNIGANTIDASKIAANTITAGQIATGTITATQMATGTITAASGILADAVITTAKIGTAQIQTLNIGDEQVTTLRATIINTTNTYADYSTILTTPTISMNATGYVFVNWSIYAGQAPVTGDPGIVAVMRILRNGTTDLTGWTLVYGNWSWSLIDQPGGSAYYTVQLYGTVYSNQTNTIGQRSMSIVGCKK